MSISKQFVLAGDATFTIEVPPGTKKADGDEAASHYTFQVQHKEKDDRWPEAWFVRVLTGPDNTKDFTYAGKLDPFTGQLVLTAKSAFPATAFRVRLFNRILARVWSGDHAAYEQFGYATHHEGTCGRCGRKLTVPSSVQEGIGPECRKVMGMPPLPTEKKARKAKAKPVVLEISDSPEIDLTGFTATLDQEGEIVYWVGQLDGREVTVLND